jgi:hypothetical protein
MFGSRVVVVLLVGVLMCSSLATASSVDVTGRGAVTTEATEMIATLVVTSHFDVNERGHAHASESAQMATAGATSRLIQQLWTLEGTFSVSARGITVESIYDSVPSDNSGSSTRMKRVIVGFKAKNRVSVITQATNRAAIAGFQKSNGNGNGLVLLSQTKRRVVKCVCVYE